MKNILNGIENKKICILGMGISNLPLIRFLHIKGACNMTVLDRSDSEETLSNASRLREEGIPFEQCFGENYLSVLPGDFDVIFKTPVVRYDIPELLAAEARGAIITSEMELFLSLCPAKVYGVTGSDGKTTTTTLIYKMLSEHCASDGSKVWVGGNIGTPLLQFVDEMGPEDRVVVELSSFQLMHMRCSPAVSVVTNITPNHLDVHKSYDEYIRAKENVFLHGGPGSLTVLNGDNTVTSHFGCETPGEVRFFSTRRTVDNGAYIDGSKIMLVRDGVSRCIMDRNDILLPGNHNVENYLAAVCAVSDDVDDSCILAVARTFGGVEHRMELVRTFEGVTYYNSSIDSSPNRTIHALSVFTEKVILIAGGKDKKIPYDTLGPVLADKVKVLILTGPTAEKIEAAARNAFEERGEPCELCILHAKTYEEAVNMARSSAASGDVVLLSPASTSFDMFRNFEERGNTFKKLVHGLK